LSDGTQKKAFLMDYSHRPGDLARIEENQSASGGSKKAAKTRKPDASSSSTGVEGVVYKVRPTLSTAFT
jgi:hypothetical protein